MKRALLSLSVLLPVAAALCLSVVWDMGYQASSAETFLVLGVACMFAMLVPILFRGSPVAANTLAVLMLTVLADIFFAPDILASALVTLIGACLAFVLRHTEVKWFIWVFSALFLVGVARQHDHAVYLPERSDATGSPTNLAPNRTSTGPIIHIVMDEMGSFDSIPVHLRPQQDIVELETAYLKRGFTLVKHVLSDSAETQLSLSTLLDDAPDPRLGANVHQPDNGFQHTVKHNGVYATLQRHGWNVKIFQSNFLDTCSETDFECHTYSRGDHNHLFSQSNLPLAERFNILGFELHRQLTSKDRGAALYVLGGRSIEYFNGGTPPIKSAYSSRPPAMVRLLDDTIERATLAGNKDALFFHVLLPHFPWVLDRNCQVRPLDQWQVANWVDNKHRSEATVFKAHWEQTLCAHRKLFALIDSVDRNHPHATIIIHGDHGPRILARRLNRSPAHETDQQLEENVLGGFLAIRAPGTVPGIAEDDGVLQDIVRSSLLRAGQT